jgi:hypothetical protein
MKMVASLVGGGLLAVIALALAKVLLGGVVGLAGFVLGLLFKVAIAVLAVWLAIRLLKSLVRPAHES